MRIVNLRQLSSTGTVLLVLVVILLLQSGVSYTLTFGRLAALVPREEPLQLPWLTLRAATLGVVAFLWVMNRNRPLMGAIIVANGLFTLGLLSSTAALFDVLFGISSHSVKELLGDLVLIFPANVL